MEGVGSAGDRHTQALVRETESLYADVGVAVTPSLVVEGLEEAIGQNLHCSQTVSQLRGHRRTLMLLLSMAPTPGAYSPPQSGVTWSPFDALAVSVLLTAYNAICRAMDITVVRAISSLQTTRTALGRVAVVET